MIIDSSLRFEKLHQIGVGQGLNSTVWLAHDLQLDCHLAVKQIDKSNFWNPNCFSEAQVVYAVSHPNIVGVQYCCEEGPWAFIAMPFYPNGSLADLLNGGPMTLSAVLKLAQEVLLGLGHIHAKGFIHLDIKPSNVFLDNQGRAMIADFGQSRKVGPGGLVSQPLMYKKTTPPEVIKSNIAAAVSDIYHVGALLYRAVNGEAAWQTQLTSLTTDVKLRDAILRGKFPNRQDFLPHVPKRLRTALRKALSVEPTARFPSAGAFASELGRIAITNDWATDMNAIGEIEWRCIPPRCAETVVNLNKVGAGWATEVHTENAGTRRAKGKSSYWGSFSSRDVALKSLKQVFESL